MMPDCAGLGLETVDCVVDAIMAELATRLFECFRRRTKGPRGQGYKGGARGLSVEKLKHVGVFGAWR
jgi:hypothetical protein